MQIPPITEVRRRLGESVALEVAYNWVTGRVGLVYFVTDPATGRRSVFKWVGLLRACYLHGPGQACLSLRGLAGGGSSREDMAAWGKDAAATARVIQALEDNPSALPVADSST